MARMPALVFHFCTAFLPSRTPKPPQQNKQQGKQNQSSAGSLTTTLYSQSGQWTSPRRSRCKTVVPYGLLGYGFSINEYTELKLYIYQTCFVHRLIARAQCFHTAFHLWLVLYPQDPSCPHYQGLLPLGLNHNIRTAHKLYYGRIRALFRVKKNCRVSWFQRG